MEDFRGMEEWNIIEHSTSEWCTSIVVMGKKDRTLRLCVDYRRLNSVTCVDVYPVPRIDELLDGIG